MAKSLVHELQRDALDNSTSASVLLRKALAVAWKLDIEDMRCWIQRELDGYSNEDTVPRYRLLQGELRAKSIHGRWVPVNLGDPDFQAQISQWSCRESISEIDATLRTRRDRSLISVPNLGLTQLTEHPVYLILSPTSFQGILDATKNEVLKWTLQLEKLGILGSEFSFSDKEKQLAQEATPPTITIHGPISNSTLQFNSPNAYQRVALSNSTQLLELLNEVREEIDGSEYADEVREQIDAIEAEVLSEKPDGSKIKSALAALKPTAEALSSLAKLTEILQRLF
jgi:hypothetical protein